MEVSVLVVIFAFVVAMTITQNRAKERRERLKVLEEAIRSGNLDPAMKQELVGELTGKRPEAPKPAPQPGSSERHHGPWARLAFGAGWLGLFLGIGLMSMDQRDTWEAGIAITALGFAFVTLPIALREFERERSRSGRTAPRR